MTRIGISEARSRLGESVRRAAHGREIIQLTDHGHVAAPLVAPQVVEDFEDSLAIAERERRVAEGVLGEGMSHDEVGRMLGLRP